jgi:hypothetical protein
MAAMAGAPGRDK